MNTARLLLKNKKWFTLFIGLISFLFSVVVFVLLVNINISKIEIRSASKFHNYNIYQITDDLIGEREIEFFKDVKNYDILNDFNNGVFKNSKVVFYNAVSQPIGLKQYPSDKKFSAYYEWGATNDIYEYEGALYQTTKSIQITKSVFDYNVVELVEGQPFDDSAYVYIAGKNEIPVILGSDYRQYFKLNDQLELQYYYEKFVGRVVGFAKENAFIFTNYDPQQVLNRYILLPSMSLSEQPSKLLQKTEVDEIFFRALLLSNIGGHLMTNLNALEVRKEIADIEKVTNFSDYQIIGANSLSVNLLYKMVDANQTLIFTISGVVFIFILCAFYLSVKSFIKRQFDTYLVFIMSGVTNNKIKKTIQLEFSILNGMSIGLALLCTVLFMQDITLLSILLIAGFMVWLVFYVVVYMLVNQLLATTNVIEKLKGD
ncbi:hypothetical protein LYSIN_03820 [Lysinibacillus sphaericus]|uniref:ABC transporter permease n=1 Tax=Lysinibacillus sphaericus TaxID=1421 RepID=A0A2S5CUI2_LYSSH|nr:hypothetical protein [Lysinibacillus sphaericus]POZ54485.1 hypothetical protein LYSIN_03820 [Lysinibacillus sphaericus]